ncbi:MAG: hypothetical protein MJY43_02950 [Bacteroidales bacterium]|nr:hypothetical protein [Bacteroidales bacterium]
MKVSARLNTVLQYARDEAMRTGCLAISTDHLLLGLLRDRENDACATLSALGVDLDDLKSVLESRLFSPRMVSFDDAASMQMARNAQNTLNLTVVEAEIAGSSELGVCHLLLAISNSALAACQDYFRSLGIDHASISSYMKAHSLLRKVEVDAAPPASFTHFMQLITDPSLIS